MSFLDVVVSLFAPLGVSVDMFILIITILGSVIIMAKDFRLGLIILFMLEAGELIFFSFLNYDITYYVLALLSTFVLMVLGLFISYKKTSSGVI